MTSAMKAAAKAPALTFTTLPAIGTSLSGGTYAGLISQPDGTAVAVVVLPERKEDLTWRQATTWAKKQGGQLPTRPVAALLFANVKDALAPQWHWTCEESAWNASCAWGCDFSLGYQYGNLKSYRGSAVAVRLIPITA
ncbi:MAG: hypothetical protein WBC18_07940 [Ottowia sp.]|uniref:hypothetical protein n=1 Tax=Ottowia sp. TaxID=1898956 RepID=UPI003C72A8E5